MPSNQKSKVSRRATLGTITAGTAAIVGLSGPVPIVRGDSLVELETIKSGEEVLETERVPRDWHEFEQIADAVHSDLIDEHLDIEGVVGAGLYLSGDSIEGYDTSEVVVHTKPGFEDLAVSESIDGVQVRIEERDFDPKDGGGDVESTPVEPTSSHDEVPGGVIVEPDDSWGNRDPDSPGTSTCMVDIDDKHYLMTAWHLYGCAGPYTGRQLWHDDQYIGQVAMEGDEQDWVAVELDPNDAEVSGFDNSIESEEGILAGRITDSGIRTRYSNGDTIYQKGSETGRTSGVITSREYTVGLDEACTNQFQSESYVELDTHTMAGDSGGPHYEPYTDGGCDYVVILGMHHGIDGNDTLASAADRIYEDHGVRFNPEFELC